ncbi:MAG: hypothetical protein Q8N09_03740 [Thermodesulfovibrionia bacterium]|nr:hypothetical protein [Thermodesulfovibrionia bacterium]
MIEKLDKTTIFSIVSLIITILLSLVLFFLDKKEMEPKYAVKESGLLAQLSNEEPKLKIIWDEIQVQNVRSADIAIWNAGSMYIGSKNISETDPIRIVVPKEINILNYKVVNTSRPNLVFGLSLINDKSSDREIQINIIGDEALEKEDGLLIRIVYSGADVNEFSVIGRIKGAKSGFKKVNWWDIAPKEFPLPLVYTILVLSILFLVLGFIVASLYAKKLKTNKSKFCVVCFINGILMIFMSIYVFFKYIKPFFFGMPWIS